MHDQVTAMMERNDCEIPCIIIRTVIHKIMSINPIPNHCTSSFPCCLHPLTCRSHPLPVHSIVLFLLSPISRKYHLHHHYSQYHNIEHE